VTRASRTVRIANELGVHLRVAGLLVQLAERYQSAIWIERAGQRANGKSIMSVLTLAAGKGSELTITAEGSDAEAAVKALADLIEAGFAPPQSGKGSAR